MYFLGRLLTLSQALKAFLVIVSSFNLLSIVTLLRRPCRFWEMARDTFAAFNRCGRRQAIPDRPLWEILPHGASSTSLFLSLDSEMSVSLTELVCLCCLAKLANAKNILEIGTFAGVTAYHLAKNTDPACKVFTMDLPQEHRKAEVLRDARQKRKCFTDLMTIQKRPIKQDLCYVGSDVQHKVIQIYADSSTYDYRKTFSQKFDLIFIDGSHDYGHVKTDSANAFQWVADNGFVVWHDYKDFPEITLGVKKCLVELRRNYDIVRILGTWLCVYKNTKRPAGNRPTTSNAVGEKSVA